MIECKECGSGPVHHRLTYVTVTLDELCKPLFATGPISRFFASGVYALERVATPRILRFFLARGIAKGEQAPDENTLLLAKVLWEEAGKRGIEVTEVRLFGLARNLFLARLPSGRSIAYEGIPFPSWGVHEEWWIDNKDEMKKRFRKLGIPVAKGGAALTAAAAKRLYRKLSPPVIVKPYSGSASRHTTLHIKDEQELLRAFRVATEVAPLAIIEEELVGPVFRATVVNGKLEGVIRRDQPHVIGDGVHSITELVAKANKHPARGGPYFSPMELNEAAREELAWQELTPESIPENGQRVTLHQKINWSVGGTTCDVTDNVHPDNQELFVRIATVLRAPIVGLDFIIEDMSRSWKEQERCGVIECNSMPFFDNHHLPFEGEPRNVAGAIWDMVDARP